MGRPGPEIRKIMTPGSLDADGLVRLTPQGLHCPAAGAWIDPWRPVPRALITHAHADHARPGCGEYWAIGASEGILRQRLGRGIRLLPVDYGQTLRLGDARVSFHSAGHVLGSAQIRLEAGGESWLISGDYKRDEDPSCAPFEPVTADVLITEATFGLPIYRWSPGREVARQILELVARGPRSRLDPVLLRLRQGPAGAGRTAQPGREGGGPAARGGADPDGFLPGAGNRHGADPAGERAGQKGIAWRAGWCWRPPRPIVRCG